jgi:hypothetical protein
MRNDENEYRNVDIDADENSDNDNGLKYVIHNRKSIAETIDLRIAERRDSSKNE